MKQDPGATSETVFCQDMDTGEWSNDSQLKVDIYLQVHWYCMGYTMYFQFWQRPPPPPSPPPPKKKKKKKSVTYRIVQIRHVPGRRRNGSVRCSRWLHRDVRQDFLQELGTRNMIPSSSVIIMTDVYLKSRELPFNMIRTMKYMHLAFYQKQWGTLSSVV